MRGFGAGEQHGADRGAGDGPGQIVEGHALIRRSSGAVLWDSLGRVMSRSQHEPAHVGGDEGGLSRQKPAEVGFDVHLVGPAGQDAV